MTDLNPDDAPKPIQVSPTATTAQSGSAMRDVLLIVGVLPALLAVLGKRDLQALVDFIASTEFAPVLGIIVTGGVVAWRQWLARRQHAESLKMAQNTPDRVAVVKGES